MIGKITIAGILMIKRGNQFKNQLCKQDNSDYETVKYCSDVCPLFNEPIFYPTPGRSASITICENRFLDFSEFTDEREACE